MTTTSPDSAAIAEVLQAEDDRCQALGAGDWDVIELILSDDFTYTHTSGRTENKAEYMQFLKRQQRPMTRENLAVRVYGNVAVMLGDLVRSYGAQEDGSKDRPILVTMQVWVKDEKQWKLVAQLGTHGAKTVTVA